MDGAKRFGGTLATGPALRDLPNKPQRSSLQQGKQQTAAKKESEIKLRACENSAGAKREW